LDRAAPRHIRPARVPGPSSPQLRRCVYMGQARRGACPAPRVPPRRDLPAPQPAQGAGAPAACSPRLRGAGPARAGPLNGTSSVILMGVGPSLSLFLSLIPSVILPAHGLIALVARVYLASCHQNCPFPEGSS
jgi:hypothetical protein